MALSRDTGSIYLTHTKHREHNRSQGTLASVMAPSRDTRSIYLTHTKHREHNRSQGTLASVMAPSPFMIQACRHNVA